MAALAQTLALDGVLPFGLLRGATPVLRLRTETVAPPALATISPGPAAERGRGRLALAWHQDEAGRLVCTWHLASP